jgi:hypothetical protein
LADFAEWHWLKIWLSTICFLIQIHVLTDKLNANSCKLLCDILWQNCSEPILKPVHEQNMPE